MNWVEWTISSVAWLVALIVVCVKYEVDFDSIEDAIREGVTDGS